MITRILTLLCLAALSLTACAKKPLAPVVPPLPPAVEAEPKPRPTPTERIYYPLVKFGFDSDSVKAKGFPSFCASLADRPVAVFGYASSERSGKYSEAASVAYNGLLSLARANATAFHLRVAGCNVVKVEGKGETWKFGRTLPPNRRVEIKVVD